VLPSTVAHTEFYDLSAGCTLGDWQVEDNTCAQSQPFCPLPFDQSEPCCTTIGCDTGNRALRFSSGSCGEFGSRFSRVLSLDAFESIRVCYQIMQNTMTHMEGVLQLMADKNDGSAPIVVTCDEPWDWHDSYPTVPCVDLPLAVADWPETRLTFLVDHGGNGDEILLGSASIYAFPQECSQQLTVIDTSFDGCEPNAGSHDGWIFSPAGGTCANSEAEGCFTGGGGLLVGTLNGTAVSEVSAYHQLGMEGARAPARVCWKHYHTAGFSGEYMLYLSNASRAWYVPIYESRFPEFALSPVCRELCVDLGGIGSSLFSPGYAQIAIQAQAASGYLLINDVRVEASQACDATGIFQISEIEPDGQGGYQIQVDDLANLPRRALLECSWGDGVVNTSTEIEFVSQ
jgi:hypothetical protein